jgi:hypothetical protein
VIVHVAYFVSLERTRGYETSRGAFSAGTAAASEKGGECHLTSEAVSVRLLVTEKDELVICPKGLHEVFGNG